MTERSIIDQPFAARGAACPLCHVGLQPDFINERNTFHYVRHERLAAGDPVMALVGHIRPLLFKRLQVFFCVNPRR